MKLIIFTTRFIPARFNAYTIGPIILVRPNHSHDHALIAHEQVHVKQFWRTFGLHGIFYRLSKKYRYKAELEAHQVQYQSGGDIEFLARFLAGNYGVGVSYNQAKRDILEGGTNGS